jgi:hypothetical protein
MLLCDTYPFGRERLHRQGEQLFPVFQCLYAPVEDLIGHSPPVIYLSPLRVTFCQAEGVIDHRVSLFVPLRRQQGASQRQADIEGEFIQPVRDPQIVHRSLTLLLIQISQAAVVIKLRELVVQFSGAVKGVHGALSVFSCPVIGSPQGNPGERAVLVVHGIGL